MGRGTGASVAAAAAGGTSARAKPQAGTPEWAMRTVNAARREIGLAVGEPSTSIAQIDSVRASSLEMRFVVDEELGDELVEVRELAAKLDTLTQRLVDAVPAGAGEQEISAIREDAKAIAQIAPRVRKRAAALAQRAQEVAHDNRHLLPVTPQQLSAEIDELRSDLAPRAHQYADNELTDLEASDVATITATVQRSTDALQRKRAEAEAWLARVEGLTSPAQALELIITEGPGHREAISQAEHDVRSARSAAIKKIVDDAWDELRACYHQQIRSTEDESALRGADERFARAHDWYRPDHEYLDPTHAEQIAKLRELAATFGN